MALSPQSPTFTPAPVSAWTPPDGVTNHAGGLIFHDAIFFEPPPAEIGQVLSAHSTATQTKHGRPAGFRASLALFIGAVMAVGGDWIYERFFANTPPTAMVGWPFLLAGAGVALLLFFALAFHPTITYVGTQGIARYKRRGGLAGPLVAEVFPFSEATELRTSQVRQYTNGVYTGTTYTYNWSNFAGGARFRLNGSYRDKKGRPKDADPFNFAAAAERSWSNYLLAEKNAELQQSGHIQFNLTRDHWVRIGRGFLEFYLGKEVERLNAEDIKELSANQGVFIVKDKDAKRFSRQGVFKFQYSSMANAQVFLMALDSLLGYRFGG